MSTKLITLGLSLALVAIPASVAAGHGNGNGQGHKGFPGTPDEATHGLCTAYENNENGRDNGQAGDAPPFQDLKQPVEKFCAKHGQHPSDDKKKDKKKKQDKKP